MCGCAGPFCCSSSPSWRPSPGPVRRRPRVAADRHRRRRGAARRRRRGRRRGRSSGRRWASTPRESRSRGRASRRTRARRRRRPASSRRTRTTPATTGASSTRAVERLVRAGIKPILMLDGPPPLWASGNPGARQPALPAERARIRATSPRRSRARYGDQRRPVHPLERAEPAGVAPAAGRLRQAALHAGVAERVPRDGPRRVPRDPRASTRSRPCSSARSRPAGGDLKSDNANMRPLEFLRGLGCFDRQASAPCAPARCRGFKPAFADGIAYHPHSTRHAPSQPYAHPDNADLGSLQKIERLLDRLQRSHRLAGPDDAAAACGSTSTATRPTRPTSSAASRPARRTATSSRPRTSPGTTRASCCSRSTCGRTSPPATGASTRAGSRGCTTPTATPKPALAHFDDPIWVDFRDNVAWGQVRPGGDAHRDDPAPRRRRRDAVGDARDGADRDRRQPGRSRRRRSPFATYRAIAEDGDDDRLADRRPAGRRRPRARTPARQRDDAARRAAHGRHRRRRADPAVVRRLLDGVLGRAELPRRHAPEPDLRPARCRRSPRGGNGAPTIRIGGNSTDETWWNPGGAPRAAGHRDRRHAGVARGPARSGRR